MEKALRAHVVEAQIPIIVFLPFKRIHIWVHSLLGVPSAKKACMYLGYTCRKMQKR